MAKSSRWMSFFKRLSIFYASLAVLVVLFLIYYYYYIPINQGEFSDRGTRVLKRHITNFLTKSEELDSAFAFAARSSDSNDFKNRNASYLKLYENTRYSIDSTSKPKQGKPYTDLADEWKIVYPNKDTTWSVLISIDDFAKQFFNARTDIFNSYVLLRNDSENKGKSWNVLFKENNIITSGQLNLDSLGPLQQNSDLSAITDLKISGTDTKLFLQLFDFHGQKLAVGGLISKRKYLSYVRHTPVNFIALTLTVIIFILIMLPFIKVYFLSPNERITSGTVLYNTFTIFVGTSAILVLVVYIFVYSVSEKAFHSRMRDIGKQISNDFRVQLHQASRQLDRYEHIYKHLSPQEKQTLAYISSPALENIVDVKFCPAILPDLTRILWFDSTGETLAKWNPFPFKPALSNVKNYEFFKRVQELNKSGIKTKEVVVYPGESNTTGEFQVYIAKPSTTPITTSDSTNVTSAGIILATALHCNTYPVLPPGFGFCLVDRQGNVLIHSDSRRNLKENMLLETRDNARLINHLKYKSSDVIPNVSLYGVPQDIFVKPIAGQPLYLIVFFNKHTLTNNISRLLHFTTSCLLYIYLALVLCILLSTFSLSRPSKIKFELSRIEWVRPSAGNINSYNFSTFFFTWLVILNTLVFFVILLLRLDVRNIFNLSMLIPLYTLWGFVISRKSIGNNNLNQGSVASIRNWLKEIYEEFPPVFQKQAKYMASIVTRGKGSARSGRLQNSIDNIYLSAKSIVITIFFFNLALIYYMPHTHWLNIVILLGVQVGYIWLLNWKYLDSTGKVSGEAPMKDKDCKEEQPEVTKKYLRSLYRAMILISVIPAFGILSYAFFSEKIQHKKTKQLHAASTYFSRAAFLKSEDVAYKPLVFAILKKHRESLAANESIYLSDKDRITNGTASNDYKASLYDEPYHALTNNLYQIAPFSGDFTIKNHAADSSWEFMNHKQSIVLQYKRDTAGAQPVKVVSVYHNPLYNFFQVLWPGGVLFIILVMLLLYLGKRVINAIMTRLFLLNFFRETYIDESYVENSLSEKAGLRCGNTVLPQRITVEFFETEEDFPGSQAEQEEYILNMTHCLAPVYEKMWRDQSEEERYLLFDLSQDGYTNYKNADTIFTLLNKGILQYRNYKLKFFSLSFRNYILSKKGTKENLEMMDKFSSSGVWKSIKHPLLMLIGVVAIFFIFTQNEVAQDVTAFIASIVAVVPMVIKLIGGFAGKSE